MSLFIPIVFLSQLIVLIVFLLVRNIHVKVLCMEISLVCLIACALASIIETIFAIFHNGDIVFAAIDVLLFALLCIYEVDYLKQYWNGKKK